MRHADLNDPPFEYDDTDPEGFRAGMYRFGPDLGARETGTTIYEIPPGQAVCPYHYEWGEEEWVMPVQGTATVRTPDGMQALGPLQVMFFPKGPEGAHQIRNDSAATIRVMMWGQVAYPTVSVYPDSDKIGAWTPGRVDNVMVVRSSTVPYYTGESNER